MFRGGNPRLRRLLIGSALCATLAVLVWWLGGVSWLRSPRQQPRPRPPQHRAAPAASDWNEGEAKRFEPTEVDPRVIDSALASVRSRLEIPPRRAPSRELAVSGDRIARVVDGGLEIVTLAGAGNRRRFELAGARAVVAFQRAFFAMGGDQGLLVSRDEKRPAELPRPILLPDMDLLPDLVSGGHVWGIDRRDAAAYRFGIELDESGTLPLVKHALVGFDSGGFAQLRDGSFVYSKGDHFGRFYASGLCVDLRYPGKGRKPAVRILGAARVDQFFALAADGHVELLHIQDRVRLVWSYRFEQFPTDLVADGNLLVALLEPPGGGEWSLLWVGPKRPETVVRLGSVVGDGDDWVSDVLAQLGLAAGAGRVAVGGRRGLRVFDTRTSEEITLPE